MNPSKITHAELKVQLKLHIFSSLSLSLSHTHTHATELPHPCFFIYSSVCLLLTVFLTLSATATKWEWEMLEGSHEGWAKSSKSWSWSQDSRKQVSLAVVDPSLGSLILHCSSDKRISKEAEGKGGDGWEACRVGSREMRGKIASWRCQMPLQEDEQILLGIFDWQIYICISRPRSASGDFTTINTLHDTNPFHVLLHQCLVDSIEKPCSLYTVAARLASVV